MRSRTNGWSGETGSRFMSRPRGPDLLDVGHQFHEMATGGGEADRFALPDRLTLADPLDREAVPGDTVLQIGEIVLVVDLERHEVHARARGVPQPQRMVILLVPALEVDLVVGRGLSPPSP